MSSAGRLDGDRPVPHLLPAVLAINPACAAAIAVMFSTRRNVDEGVSTCAGRSTPIRIGPTVVPSPSTIFSTLNRMFAASMFGQMRMFASPGEAAFHQQAAADDLRQRGIAVHLAVAFDVGVLPHEDVVALRTRLRRTRGARSRSWNATGTRPSASCRTGALRATACRAMHASSSALRIIVHVGVGDEQRALVDRDRPTTSRAPSRLPAGRSRRGCAPDARR